MLRRRLKFAAVLVAVVLALTGFSSSRGGKGSGSGGSSGDGGGCSNAEKNNGSYANSGHNGSGYDANDDYGSSGGSSGGSYRDDPTPTATSGVRAEVITCVRPARGKRKAVTYAAVRLEAGSGAAGAYEVEVTFMDAAGVIADSGDTEVTLESGETRTVRVAMDSPAKVARVRACDATASLAG
ncbi:hypothetical protein [Streptomyces sp. AK02-01A]|uniref:hypothetical protein n=1 Tax=Streptomyces sp. AK02-01A TaxID=3028648 RepID=UPI0029AD04F7|nr:hypothetical protein [Streptomyces sp. AK02-01A]MDX3851781.1 hypothetical protein [Streptomyces sp. AK02-01A]